MDKFVVYDATTGETDVAATVAAYATALTSWKSTNELPTSQVEAAVEAAFDSSEGERTLMPLLVNSAIVVLNVQPDNYNAAEAQVRRYITGQAKTGRLSVVRRKGGGVSRLARPGEPLPVAKTG